MSSFVYLIFHSVNGLWNNVFENAVINVSSASFSLAAFVAAGIILSAFSVVVGVLVNKG